MSFILALAIGLAIGLGVGVLLVHRWKLRLPVAWAGFGGVLLIFWYVPPIGLDPRIGLLTGCFGGFLVSVMGELPEDKDAAADSDPGEGPSADEPSPSVHGAEP